MNNHFDSKLYTIESKQESKAAKKGLDDAYEMEQKNIESKIKKIRSSNWYMLQLMTFQERTNLWRKHFQCMLGKTPVTDDVKTEKAYDTFPMEIGVSPMESN